MVSKPFENKEYIDWVEDFLADTALEGGGPARVTLPTKMDIRDFAVLISGPLDDASVLVQYSPDEMETAEADIDPDTMQWYDRDDGTFTKSGVGNANIWENLDGAEGWFRFKFIDITGNTDPKVKTRPRVEKVI